MYERHIVYDADTHDYACYLKSGTNEPELVGFARTRDEANKLLDDLIFELMSGHYFREQPI